MDQQVNFTFDFDGGDVSISVPPESQLQLMSMDGKKILFTLKTLRHLKAVKIIRL